MTYTSIEKILLTPGTASQTVNIIGDNDGNNPGQDDNIAVIGGDTDGIPATGGVNKFWVVINGSGPIGVDGTRFLNIDTMGGTNGVTIKPYADNVGAGPWGVAANVTSSKAGSQNTLNYGNITPYLIDPMPAGGIAGVSEDITVTPTPVANPTPGDGQIFVPNVATMNFTNFQDLNFYTNDGSAGDTDTLTIDGTAVADYDVANFANAGTNAAPWLSLGLGTTSQTTHLFNVDQFLRETASTTTMTAPTPSALPSVSIATGDGSDTLQATGTSTAAANNAPTTLDYDGGNPTASDTLLLTGTANADDSYAITPGVDSESGTAVVTLAASPATTISYSGIEHIAINGGGGTGNDSITLNGTGANDVFTATAGGVGGTTGTAQVDAGPAITFTALGSSAGTSLTLNQGGGGSDVFALTQAAAGNIPTVTVNGGATSTVTINGTASPDIIGVTPLSASSATVVVNGVTTYNVSGAAALDINGQGGNVALTVTSPAGATVTLTPGSTVDSGLVQVNNFVPLSFQNLGTAATLTLAYASANLSNTLIYEGTPGDDSFSLAAGTGAITLNSQIAVSAPAQPS